jgi:hypothetical protein
MNKTIALVLLLALAGCGDTAPAPTAPAAAEPPPAETGGERLGDPAGHPTGGPPVAPGPDGGAYGFDTCVKECVRSRQMQAVSMEKIEADCQGECAATDAGPR